jgi:acetylornithine deacetylase/succinyl-diaminopimelate desuccinylase-like protein
MLGRPSKRLGVVTANGCSLPPLIYSIDAERSLKMTLTCPPAQLRTTCVANMLEGGHAYNALPQVARATINCRIMPGEPVDEVKATLVQVLADDQISVTQIDEPILSAPSALHEEIMGGVEKVSAEFWPGTPIVPTMSAGATDGSYLRNAGIPTYGHSGLASDVDDVRVHGKDERVLVKSFFDGQEYLYRLVKVLSGGK